MNNFPIKLRLGLIDVLNVFIHIVVYRNRLQWIFGGSCPSDFSCIQKVCRDIRLCL